MKKYFYVFLFLALWFGAGLVLAASSQLPDLTVSKVTAKPKTVKGIKKATITYTIKNIGTAAAPASLTKIDTGNGLAITQVTPPLKPGQNYSTSWDCSLAQEGNMRVKVSADYINNIRESNELNNSNTMQFSVGRAVF